MTDTNTSILRPKRRKKPIVDKALALLDMGYEPFQLDAGRQPESGWMRLINQREVLGWSQHGLGVRLLGGMFALTITARSDLSYDRLLSDLSFQFLFTQDAPFRNENDDTVTFFARAELLGKAFSYRGGFIELRCNPDLDSYRHDSWAKVWDRQTEGETSGFFDGGALWEVPYDDLPVLAFAELNDLIELLKRHDNKLREVP